MDDEIKIDLSDDEPSLNISGISLINKKETSKISDSGSDMPSILFK